MAVADADPLLLDYLPYRATDTVWVGLNRNEFRPLAVNCQEIV